MATKTRKMTLGVAALVIASLAVVNQATASHNALHKAFSGGATFKGLVVKTESASKAITSVVSDFETVDSRSFQIPAGDSELIVVDFSAETFCSGSGRCRARVMIGRTLGTAQQAEPAVQGTFLDTASDDGVESHAMTGSLCVRNATSSPVDLSVWLQATRADSGTLFTLDRYSLKIARNSPCTPAVNI